MHLGSPLGVKAVGAKAVGVTAVGVKAVGVKAVGALAVTALAVSACGGSSAMTAASPVTAALDAMLDVRADGCSATRGFGTATLIDDTLALTAAHVVAGAEEVAVIDLDGIEHDARVVWFDPELDLAALLVPADIGTPVDLQPTNGDEIDRGVVAVSRGVFADREVTTAEVSVSRHVDVATTDIYLDGEVIRPGFEVIGDIEPGDSGTMVVSVEGAAGVVWSRSTIDVGRAWAVDVPDEFSQDTFRGSLDADVDPGPCLS